MNDSTKMMSNDDSTRFGKSRHPLVDLLVRLVREKPLGLLGGIIVIILLFTGIFAGTLSPYEINKVHLRDRLSPPST